MSKYAYIHYNETIAVSDFTVDGSLVQLTREHRAGTTDLVSINDYNMFMRSFPDRIVGKEISDSCLADVATLVYDGLIRETEQMHLSESDRSWLDVKRESLESIRNDEKFDPSLCDGVDDICSKVMTLQEEIRNIQNREVKTTSVIK